MTPNRDYMKLFVVVPYGVSLKTKQSDIVGNLKHYPIIQGWEIPKMSSFHVITGLISKLSYKKSVLRVISPLLPAAIVRSWKRVPENKVAFE